MSIDSKMTALADELRFSAGISGGLSIDDMIITAAGSPSVSGNVPDYVRKEAERTAAEVKAFQSGDSLSFIAFSDRHVQPDYQESILHASMGAKIIRGLVSIDFTADLGDMVLGAGSDSFEGHMENLLDSLRLRSVAETDFNLIGNHDSNVYNPEISLSPEVLGKYSVRFNKKGASCPEEAERGYFYYDFPEKKTRVICLNSSDTGDFSKISPESNGDGHYIGKAQLEWLVSALDMSGKDGWRIIVLSHHPIHWGNSMNAVLGILNGYIGGTAGNVSAVLESGEIPFDFSGKNGAKLIGCFNGHLHNFVYGKRGENEICQMTTPNACFDRNNEYGSADYPEEFRRKFGDIAEAEDGTIFAVNYPKTEKTGKDTAFCVYTLDFEKGIISAVCYGAGTDRILSWSQEIFYLVTANLENAEMSGGKTVPEGESYYSEIVPEEGFSIESVSVKMGGTDITDSAYSDGTISIEEVTGDIVIEVVAKAIVSYKNLVPLSVDAGGNIFNGTGYKEGYRLNSSGGETEFSGAVCSGFIPYTVGDIIRAFGTKESNAGNSAFYIVFYDSAFAKLGAYPLASGEGRTFEAFDGKYIAEVNSADSAFEPCFSEGEYFRISMPECAAEDFVVTVNEEIKHTGESTYKNMIPVSIGEDGNIFNGTGFKEGYRISTSSGNESAASGISVTGFIPITSPSTVRVRDIGMGVEQSTWAVYDSNFAFVSGGYCNSTFGAEDENGTRSYTWELNGYLRISGIFGENPVVTVNEEIK